MQRWTILMATLAPLPGRGIDEMIAIDLPPDEYLPGTVRARDLERGLVLPEHVSEVIIAESRQDPETLAVYGLDDQHSVLFRVETSREELPVVFDYLGDRPFFW
jgi:hypothetical protein